MPALPARLGERQGPPPAPGTPAGPDAITAALLRGLVVACPGARGRTLRGADGRWTGKAPAAIVDLKAAVRWLRAQADRMPGDTRRIVSNGTSAGGALSSLLGASGDTPAPQAELLASGLLGMAQIAARRWLREEPRMAREAAVDLIAGLGWRGIGGFPLSHPPTA